MEAYLLDWANLLVRWLHLISGIAWIGASFYFVMLDLSLRKPARPGDEKRGVFGELWAVHGGGVYHSEKFLGGPLGEPLSDHLHWSKWEAYTTWLSGMGMLCIIYWFGASTYLIDPSVMPLSVMQAVAISFFAIVISWFVYDILCRWLGHNEKLLALVLFIYIVLIDFALFQVFSARAAYLHVGAIMGSIMVANVFFQIIPGQKKMVAEIRAGQTPNPKYGIIGKQRSVHNTYFTLPLLFAMISNHYPMTYSHPQGWLVLIIIMLAGVLIRQFFVQRHLGQQQWWLPAVALVLLIGLIAWMKPQPVAISSGEKISFSTVEPIIQQRCVPCHAQTPTQPGFSQPPKGIVLQSRHQINQHGAIIAQTVGSKYMPIGNLTGMTDQERSTVMSWLAQTQPTAKP
jgi:uncharacterized membrane protein